MASSNIRAIAFYLPQFHPIPENNSWWGTGFTEWTNVAKAKPLFKKHDQPRIPSELGFYDLRLAETREAQAKMAAAYGIEGFCYWHYWFGNGKTILERPFAEVLASKSPDFPFCLAWANGSWTGIWHGSPKKILIQQEYPGVEDYTNFFNYLLPAFKDERYITVNNKPLFCINEPNDIPDIKLFTETFRKLANQNGLPGLYIVANTGSEDWDPTQHGCDAVNHVMIGNLYKGLPVSNHKMFYKLKNQFIKHPALTRIYRKLLNRPVHIFNYRQILPFLITQKQLPYDHFPCVIPNWDNSPRSGINSMILTNSTPHLFSQHIRDAIAIIENNEDEKKIVFLKSWNEWAEGNYLEPDLKFGKQYLEALHECLK
ncbi:glycoside hydrolase family 99-like domain-containing protein [Mucilaginibacter koreensis]